MFVFFFLFNSSDFYIYFLQVDAVKLKSRLPLFLNHVDKTLGLTFSQYFEVSALTGYGVQTLKVLYPLFLSSIYIYNLYILKFFLTGNSGCVGLFNCRGKTWAMAVSS